MIEVDGLVKRFGAATAVDGLSFTVRAGKVTGFLGPNGAGKSTTMRMILGLNRPSAGRATVAGKAYREHRAPLTVAGALLEGGAVHRGRTAREHLLGLARTHGIPPGRVGVVLEEVGLAGVTKRAGAFSLGMGQRLGIAAALLGDPAVVILDEPVNGLDPDGVLWIRTLLRRLAGDGRTVLVSSHLMSEMAVTADHLLVIGNGRLLADTGIDALLRRTTSLVRSPDAARLRDVLVALGATVTAREAGRLEVAGLGVEEIGAAAAEHRLAVYELTGVKASLEQAYMELVKS
ncbi:ATP-binding cassette domain-containing protein [Actinoplanes sp. HUAS TT8]|uniref:ATP-binding cassette domain-containing protein n=1 Tax=Actinoplanes sp. HUAS TT8 TaxID=3447453 RepID=UPI003F523529